MRALERLGRCVAIGLALGCGCGADDTPGPTLDAGSDASVPNDREDGGRDANADDPDGEAPDLDAREPDADTPDAARDASDVDAGPDEVAPELITSSPVDGDDSVDFDRIHWLEFSEPVVLGDGAITLHAEGDLAHALAVTATLRDGGSRVELTFDELPELPADLRLELSAAITDAAGNALEPRQLSFGAPIWHRIGAVQRTLTDPPADLTLAVDLEGRPVLLGVEGSDVFAYRYDDGIFGPLGDALNQDTVAPSPGAESRVALAIGADGEPIAAFRDGSAVVVLRWDGTAWTSAGDVVDSDGGGSYAPALAIDEVGRPIVAFDDVAGAAGSVLRVRALQGTTWQTLADLPVEARGVRLARAASGELAIAYQETATGISALRWDGVSAFVPLGSGAPLDAVSGSFALSASGADGYTLTAQGQGTIEWADDDWTARAEDLGFLVSSQAAYRAIAHDAGGALFAAFAETPAGASAARVYVERYDGARFQPLGPALNGSSSASATRPALAIDLAGKPIVAWIEQPADSGGASLYVSGYNGDPEQPPYGLRERTFAPGCLASAPVDGSSLTATGCFADAIGREPVAGFIPFDVRSPLWSDGAYKRRFVMLPEGETIAYRDPGIWTLPAGSIVMKEFSIEARRGDPSSLRPVETRFLIVRDGGATWDRYSYQWNQEATSAVLRTAAPVGSVVSFEVEDEGGDPATQDHFFPNRAACLACHQAPGTVLGLQTAMLQRNLEYGATADNQLRALEQLGVFGDSFDAAGLATARFMPNPADTTYPLERRLRAYLHANCSSCHHPEANMDLRIEVSTPSSNLCTKITKGDLDASVIYWRDVLRGNIGQPGTAPMPPLGTLVGNPQLEALLTDWILDPANACP